MKTRRIIAKASDVRVAIKEKIKQAIEQSFPITGGTNTATISNIVIKDKSVSTEDLKNTLMSKGNISEGLYCDIEVKKDGHTIGYLKQHRLLNIPWLTKRNTILLDGNEYAIVSQMRTKSGVYTRKRGNDELESSFNLAKGANFKLIMDPSTGLFKIDILGHTMPALCVLRILGATPEMTSQAIGEELYRSNAAAAESKLDRARDVLYNKLVTYKEESDAKTPEEKNLAIRNYFRNTEVDPETTAITLGQSFNNVSTSTILSAMSRLLTVYNGQNDVDERDHLEFQKIYCVEDLLAECITKSKDSIKKISGKLAQYKPSGNVEQDKKALKVIFSPAYFTAPLHRFITGSSLSRLPSQINPVEFADTASIVTRLGEGAISTVRAVPFETRGINYSYLGVIDPIAAPESDKVGIDNHATATAAKGEDNEFYKEVLNCKTGKLEQHRCIELHHKYVGFPDPLYKKDKKPTDEVPAVYKGKLVEVKRSELDYQLPSPHSMTTLTTSTIPFMNANQGNRLLMGDKHVQQALPLLNADKRLVYSGGNSMGKNGSTVSVLGDWANTMSDCDGTVIDIQEGAITVLGKDGKEHVYDYSVNMPLASKTFLDDKVIVKVGDKVTNGQRLTESNFTKDGEITMGKNLTVAYMPYHGYNHEDGVVISESTAKKLTSVHSSKVSLHIDKNTITGKGKYAASFPTNFTKDQLAKLDEDGVVKKGEILEEGDPVILALEDNLDSRLNHVLGMLHKSLKHPYRDVAEVYEMHYPAEVVGVQKTQSLYSVVLKINKPMQLGDKLAGSYGNKGVVSHIVPDKDMIRDESGKPVDAIFTSVGVISRINPGQILESSLGKVAKKTGKRYEIENFSIPDCVSFVKNELQKHNVKDKETVTDPVTGKKIPNIFVGVQHCHKLFKTTDTNYAARGIEGPHDQDEAPTGSGELGPKALGGMEINALIGHNVRALLYEGSILRNSKNAEFWKSFQEGRIPQMPQEKKTFTRFVATLKQAGVNVVKNGNDLMATPLTDKDVLEMSNGEIKNGLMLQSKNLSPEDGGLFDPILTGGMKGDKWTHINLAEPVVNPVFANPARTLLGMTTNGFEDYCVEVGGAKVKERLNSINIDKELSYLDSRLREDKITASERDTNIKKIKYLRALKDLGMKAGDAYVLSVLPVTPPTVRPITVGKDGNTMGNDANDLYKNTILQNESFKRANAEGLGNKTLRENRKALMQRVKELVGISEPEAPALRSRGIKGALSFISGDVPKEGYFYSKIIYGKMNLSGRATISPDTTLGLDEVGLPEKMAWSLYKPFITKEMVRIGYTPLTALDAIEEKSDVAKKILEEEMAKRPVIINRAPTLWQHGVLAAHPVLRSGSNLRINSIWEKGFNADYDGDAMQVHLPVSDEAIQDAEKLLPSKHVFTDKGKNDITMAPTNEPIIGLYKATANVGKLTGNEPVHKFKNVHEAWLAYYAGKLKMTDCVFIG